MAIATSAFEWSAMQVARATGPRGNLEALRLPHPSSYVILNIRWGSFDRILTPAFWKVQCWIRDLTARKHPSYRFGSSLLEEVVACVLGGYGVSAEVGYAAFFSLLDAGLIRPGTSEAALCAALSHPLRVNGRRVRYRFAKQRANRIAGILAAFERGTSPPIQEVQKLYAWLRDLPGIGPKTASWIVRNLNPTAQVAVIDVHVFRAGLAMGLFNSRENVTAHYDELQTRFLSFCAALEVSPTDLDVTIWRTMKDLGAYGVDTAQDMARAA